MDPCKRMAAALDEYAVGLRNDQELDFEHLSRCGRCRAGLEKAREMRLLLHDYTAQVAADAERDLAMRQADSAGLPPERRRTGLRRLRRLGVAAAVLIAFLLGVHFQKWGRPEPAPGQYLKSMEAQAARSELLSFIGQTQLFLFSLLDQSAECSESHELQRELADRLIYRKQLLNPKLENAGYADLRPLFDRLEMLLLEVAEGEGCFRREEFELWRRMIESDSTLFKLKLLQNEDRI